MEPLSGPRVMTRLSKLDLNRGLRCLRRSGNEGRPFIVSGWTLSFSNVSATQKMLAVGMAFDSCNYLLCTGA